MAAPAWDEVEHPRDRLGRFREKLSFDPSSLGEFPDRFTDEVSAMYDPWREGLSDPEYEALSFYAQDQEIAAAMNTELREGGIDDPELTGWIRQATDALARSEVPENTVVYRSLSDLAIVDAAKEGNLIGATVADDGFMSTTLDGSFSGSFDALDDAQPLEPGDTQERLEGLDAARAVTETIATIRVPKGAHGAYLGDLSSYDAEQELLLQNGTKLTVTGARVRVNKQGNATLFIALDLTEQLA